jgi:tRNA-binding EMAP/Myf-like protein
MKLCKYYKTRDLWHKKCIVLCNINPINKSGVTSTARVLVAAKPGERELLRVPNFSITGEFVQIKGYNRDNLYDPLYTIYKFDRPKRTPKRKIFAAVSPDLRVNADRVATYRDIPLYIDGADDKGYVISKTITNGWIR